MKSKLFATGGNGPRKDGDTGDDAGGVDPDVPTFAPKKDSDTATPAPAAPQ